VPELKKNIAIIILFFFTLPLNAHVEHYDNLNRIEFDIYRNNKNIGKHIFSFAKSGDKLEVKSDIHFKIKKLGVVLYKYKAEGTEIFKNGKLIEFTSNTNQNKKIKYVKMKLKNDKYIIDGSSYKGEAPIDYQLGTWWNHSIVKANAQISAVSGRIIKQKVEFIGKEKIKLGDKIYNTLHFNFSSTDKSLTKDKKLNTHIWYEEETLNWVKATFKKSGNWEYRLVSIK